jgi:hypothetical protein
VVESTGLLNRRRGLNLYRGFESPPLRQSFSFIYFHSLGVYWGILSHGQVVGQSWVGPEFSFRGLDLQGVQQASWGHVYRYN